MLRRLSSSFVRQASAGLRLASSARQASEAVPAGSVPKKLNFSLLSPHQSILSQAEVDMVIIPGSDGLFGVLPGHVPIITELKPGVVTVQVDNTVDRYFVSSGFAFVHPDSSTEVCALEAVKVSDLDPDAVRVGLEGAKSSLASAADGNFEVCAFVQHFHSNFKSSVSQSQAKMCIILSSFFCLADAGKALAAISVETFEAMQDALKA
jgi:F-type H+-transporting ATPase subunit delta